MNRRIALRLVTIAVLVLALMLLARAGMDFVYAGF
jgi:hypothetical protein